MSNPAAQRVVVVGAGGHARETAWVAEAMGHTVVGLVVSDTSQLVPMDGAGRVRDSVDRVLGNVGWLATNRDAYDGVAMGIGSPTVRLRVALEVERAIPGVAWPALVHPSSVLDARTVSLGRGAYVGARVVATVNVVLADWACLNFGCTVGHEARIGRSSVVNPGANVSGGVLIGEAALVGAGACVLQYLSVGDRAVVGAGAVVIRDVPAETTVIGVPARRAH